MGQEEVEPLVRAHTILLSPKGPAWSQKAVRGPEGDPGAAALRRGCHCVDPPLWEGGDWQSR